MLSMARSNIIYYDFTIDALNLNPSDFVGKKCYEMFERTRGACCNCPGDEALMLVEEDRPDIIVLDWMLPGVSGIEICRRLKMRRETRAVPIIISRIRSA